MEYSLIVGQRIIIMFVILLMGALCYLRGMITKDGTKQLSKIALNLVNPLLIFMSYQTDYDDRLFRGLMWAFALSAISFAFCIIITKLLIPKKTDDSPIERFSTLYSNCGFIGIPLINGLYGTEGVLYLTAYITCFNLLVWTHGMMTMKDERDFSAFKKALKSPSVIAVFVGLLCFLLQARLPEIPSQSLKYVADMNTPLAMLIAGATAAQNNIPKSLRNKRIFYVSFLKLLLLPALAFLIINLLPAPQLVKMTILIASACPAATTCTMFAITLDKNPKLCSEIFSITTILSCITLPLIVLGAGYIVK